MRRIIQSKEEITILDERGVMLREDLQICPVLKTCYEKIMDIMMRVIIILNKLNLRL